MIGYLRGIVAERHPPRLVVEVAGVGYELEAPLSTFSALPSGEPQATIYTQLLVRDDTFQLYGFASQEERSLFRMLIRASGVGPKLALAILSGLSVEEFARAVAERDVATLKRLPGIGQKTAERLLVDMADRMPPAGEAVPALGEADAALIALGYKPREVAAMLAGVRSDGRSSEAIVREALRRALGSGR